ncbi:uncharacterized protein I206_103682 [Kwoniella pini CBS 10737]|uniref:PWI domain-containing protein n=1 Tax=Kwoniella pini CBS 10737 TaxID=1296096 RepID=A0A1B9I991_9TREE|nr:uncharacterized protein I206_01318 [Kwoniella pini CBS 10737]OCF52034.1 hypothetical protein I206_01318 [Kwoniella pini CBS 10737]
MRGTNAAQDSRFKDKEAASIKSTKFPKHFAEKVDLRKVNLSVLRPWIASKVTELIKIEDDVVVEYVFGMLEDKEKPIPDPKKMQISLVGFMDKHGAAAFMDALWTLLLSAQNTIGGVPAEFIEAKKKELQAKQNIQPYGNRPQAEDSFGRRGDNGLPSRPGPPGGGGRRSPPPPPRDRDRDDRYRPGGRDDYRPRPPRRDFDRDRERDNGYGQRRRSRSRDRSPPHARGAGYRRRSPSPRRRSPSPRRRSPERPKRRSPSPSTRRRSPSPSTRRRDGSITPPSRNKREDIPPQKADRGRARSRTPTPSAPGSRSGSRSPTVTPPRRRSGGLRRDSTPPRNRRRGSSVSPPPKRRRSPSDSRSRSRSPGVSKKGRGRFTVEDGKEDKDIAEPKKGKSRWD